VADRTAQQTLVRRKILPRLSTSLEAAEDDERKIDQFLFGKGQWMPTMDPLVSGKENFADLQNLRYSDDGIESVRGHSKINTTALTTYLKGRAMYQLRAHYTTKSRVLAQVWNTGLTAAQIVENTGTIPAQADFSGTALGSTAASRGRFAEWPAGHVAFCDGETVKVWAGDEAPASFVSMSTHIEYHDEYTRYLRTDDKTSDESLPLMADGWNQTQGTLTTASSRDLASNGADAQAYAGRFQASRNGYIHGVAIKLKKTGNPAGNLVAKIYSAAGTYPADYPDVASGIPYLGAESGDDLITESGDTITSENTATSDPVACDSLTDDFTYIRFTFPSPVELTAEIYYWIILTADPSYVYADGVTEVVCYTANYTNSSGLTPLQALDIQAADDSWNHKVSTDEFLSFQIQYKVYVYFGTTRPAQAFKCYIDSAYANACTAALSLEYASYGKDEIDWTAVSGLTDGTASAGVTMAKTGTLSFTQPSDQRPVFINGMSLYWYRAGFNDWLHLAEVAQDGYDAAYCYQVTCDRAWQEVRSLWSGETMVLTGFKIFDGTQNQDYTDYMNDESQTTDTESTLDAFGTDKRIYIQTASPAQGFMFYFIPGEYNTNACTIKIERYQGVWVPVTNYLDRTALSGASFGQDGTIAFDVDEDDKTLSLDGDTPHYTYRLSFSADFSATVSLYYVAAVEAPMPIDGYDFPFMFRNRPLLCAYSKGNEGNRVDFGMTDTADVFTGSDASLGMNNAPLYFGGQEPLTAAIEMYNRLGSTIYHVAVFCKANETYLLAGYDADTYQIYRVSAGAGCPAPATMDTVEIGYDGSETGERYCIAIWLSFMGPVTCDTSTVTPIPGVSCYFDRNDSRCINWSAVSNACGIVDTDRLEYNLCIPSGSGQTTNNVWLVYDLSRKRWYRKVPNDGNVPQAFCRVTAENGSPYVYACYDDGYMRRIDNGDWDGSDIECVVKTADLIPTGGMWDITRIRYFKLLAVTAETVSVSVNYYKDGILAATALSDALLTSEAAMLTSEDDEEIVTEDHQYLTGEDTVTATRRYVRDTQAVNLPGWSHQFELSFDAPDNGLKLLGWAWQYTVEREDLHAYSG